MPLPDHSVPRDLPVEAMRGLTQQIGSWPARPRGIEASHPIRPLERPFSVSELPLGLRARFDRFCPLSDIPGHQSGASSGELFPIDSTSSSTVLRKRSCEASSRGQEATTLRGRLPRPTDGSSCDGHRASSGGPSRAYLTSTVTSNW
jgi:hypothetical protein